MQLVKNFPDTEPPQYMVVTAHGSMNFSFDGEELQTYLDMYQRLGVQVRVYEIKENPA